MQWGGPWRGYVEPEQRWEENPDWYPRMPERLQMAVPRRKRWRRRRSPLNWDFEYATDTELARLFLKETFDGSTT